MKNAKVDVKSKRPALSQTRRSERGGATVISLLVMGLLTIFVSLALSRTTTEALIMGNDTAEARSFYAAQASIETMTRNFNKIYDLRLSPVATDITKVQTDMPIGFGGFTFTQSLARTGVDEPKIITGGPFEGLNALRDPWRLETIAKGPTGVEVQLTRTFFSNRVPIFQFGLFYNDDMELSPGAAFDFGGRVHSNGNFFIRGGGTVQFNSRVTASKEIVVDVARNGRPNVTDAALAPAGFGQNIYIRDAAGTFQQLRIGQGSVIGGPDVTAADTDMPDGVYNSGWTCKGTTPRYACRPNPDIYNGNLIANVKKLELPLKLGGNGVDNIEIIKRAEAGDNQILSLSRYYNKPGIRVSLSDSQTRLPGGAGGIRLDANYNSAGVLNGSGASYGYKSKPMIGGGSGYKTTRMNAYRLYSKANDAGATYPGGMNREVWIKVEIVNVDAATLAITTTDITEDILSLGFTEEAPDNLLFRINDSNYPAGTDSRAILKLQRWVIPGPPVKRSAYTSTYLGSVGITQQGPAGGLKDVFTYVGSAPNGYNFHADNDFYYTNVAGSNENNLRLNARVNGSLINNDKVVPFPIKMFDAREGIPQESDVVAADLSVDDISHNGVMSMIDIDVNNLREFLRGDYNGQFPNGLTNASVPRDRGWIMYVSDRRGDRDNDGEFDMEDVYGPNDNTLQTPEDVNNNGVLDVDYGWEAERYSTVIKADLAAFADHRYFRRGVRLINGAQLPGDMNNGFTLASENGTYIFGNYNATGVDDYGTPTAASDYLPGGVAAAGAPWIANNTQVPASVVADAVTIISNPWNGAAGWSDGASFGAPVYTRVAPTWTPAYPGRPARETTVRTAILQGDTISSMLLIPHQMGAYSERLNGSVNNFKRFLEDWRATNPPNVNYSGSLINLFNSRNNTGPFKYGETRVYNAPNRNWVFDESFLDASRLPPGTPFFQYIQVTGFQRMNK